MSYTKTNWVDNSAPDINADNLNHMEEGIYNAHEAIPTSLSELSGDATHRLVTDAEKADWDGKSVVEWNQITTTGTKIATVNIDGDSTDVYAPTSGGGGATSLSGLDDVSISSPTDNQVLTYNSTSGKWENENAQSGASSLDELTNVEITTPSNNEVLKYDSTTNKWVNGTGGGGGTSDYEDLTNKPQINGVALTGNKTSSDLKLDGVFASAETVVGSWDGKPLYRKCFSADNVNITSSRVLDASLTPTNITPTKIDATYKFGDAWYDGTFYFIDGTGYTAYTRADSNGLDLVVTNRTVQGYRIAIYYTKNAE